MPYDDDEFIAKYGNLCDFKHLRFLFNDFRFQLGTNSTTVFDNDDEIINIADVQSSSTTDFSDIRIEIDATNFGRVKSARVRQNAKLTANVVLMC